MAARRPGAIARCADVADVQIAVRTAADLGILTAVRCGGHSLAGFGSCDGGLVIDLSHLRQVEVDGTTRRAKFAGGCLLGTVDSATQRHGLVFPAGVVSHTGAGDGGTFSLVLWTSKKNLIANVTLHLPYVGGVRFKNVYSVKVHFAFVLLRQIVQGGNLPPKGWSSIAAEDQHHGSSRPQRAKL